MEYTVQKLADLAGVSARTLRYYDRIGLLSPGKIGPNGYRIYGGEQVDRLQQILFYRELGLTLGEIAGILNSAGFDAATALSRHRQALLKKREQLDALIRNVDATIESRERGAKMSDKQKFEGFKQELIDENERKYGGEIREKYGDEQVDASNALLRHMTREQFDEMQDTGEKILELLDEAFESGDAEGQRAREMAALHKKWLGYTWPQYTPEAHAGLARMYVDDGRFAEYYDRGTPGKAAFLRDAIVAFTKR